MIRTRRVCLGFLMSLALVIGCSGGNEETTKVLSEGVFPDFLRVELESAEEPMYASCRKRTDGTGVDLFINSDKSQLNKGKLVPAKVENGKLMVDIEWPLFGDGRKQVWMDGVDKLGEWKTEEQED